MSDKLTWSPIGKPSTISMALTELRPRLTGTRTGRLASLTPFLIR